MNQHIVRGRGAPNFVPAKLLQHYINLDTAETWISRGTDYVEDWGTPLLDLQTVLDLLHEFGENVNSGDGLNSVLLIEVQNLEGRRVAFLELPAAAGRFVIITDPEESDEDFEIELRLAYNSTVRLGVECKIYNNTNAEPTLIHESDMVSTAGSVQVAPGIQNQGVVTIKHVGQRDTRRHWLVFGNTTRDPSGVSSAAYNAERLDGQTREEIIAEARQLANDSKKLVGVVGVEYTTDAELEDQLGQVADTINTLADSLN